MVALELSRKSGVPLYVQLKEKIRRQVESGSWEPGYKLPTERELAGLLGVSRNTVSQAFRELESEGILSVRQGKGTFLAQTDAGSLSSSRSARLSELVSQVLEQALEEGFSCRDFCEVVEEVASRRERMLSRVDIVFIECNREQVDYFSRQLELGSEVYITPIVLEELKKGGQSVRAAVEAAQMVVTTFFHEEEVARIVPSDKRVLAVALDPQLETIVRLARIPRRSRLGLVCISRTFAEKVIQSIKDAGIDTTPMVCTSDCPREQLDRVVKESDVILVSPGRKREVSEQSPPGKELLEFVYRPDMGSVNLLKKAILDIRERGV